SMSRTTSRFIPRTRPSSCCTRSTSTSRKREARRNGPLELRVSRVLVLDDLAVAEDVLLVGLDAVLACAAVDDVPLAVLRVDRVVAGAAVDAVIAGAAGQVVVARTAVHDIVPGAPVLDVVSGPTVQQVVPRPAVEHVV